MCQSSLSRRQLLRYAALVGATLPAVGAFDRGWALSEQSGSGIAAPINLELVTVTDTEAAIT